MAKDPAFLFYSSDFLTGTQFFTDEQIGQYMRLLCLEHQQGRLQEKHMLFICKTRDNDVLKKFIKDDKGLYYNERLEIEVNKRKAYSESRSKNRNSAKEKPIKPKPIKKPKPLKSYVPHMENEIEIENEIKDERENAKKVPQENKIIFPFHSEKFNSMWVNWKEYKLKEFKFSYKSAQSEQASLSELASLSKGNEDLAIEIIMQSIAKSWKGFFELINNNRNGAGNKTGSKSGSAAVIPDDKPYTPF